MRVEFVVPGVPMGKQRPRFSKYKGQVRTYTPAKTVNYENLVKTCYEGRKLQGAVEARIIGVFPVPSSASKKRQRMMLEGQIQYTKKCDCDNLAKIILDSLNHIAYDDDAQVVKLTVEKRYGENPHTEVYLWERENTEI